jgi:hypothetical protein
MARSSSPAPSERTRVRRAPARADYDRATIDAILDEALVAHLGFAVDGQPYVIPTLPRASATRSTCTARRRRAWSRCSAPACPRA